MIYSISENLEANKKIWIDSGIHAREWVAPASVTNIIYKLTRNWDVNPAYMRNKTWYFMPVVNPDGYMYSRRKDRLWRKNRAPHKTSKCKGVDINRNFNVGWATVGSSNGPCHDAYHGKAANSELETRAMVNFLESIKDNLEAYLSFHSCRQAFIYPYGTKSEKTEYADTLDRVCLEAARRIYNATGKLYVTGASYEILKLAAGTSKDWAYEKLGVKYAFTVELRDRGRFGFILPPAQILATASEGYIFVEEIAKDMSF